MDTEKTLPENSAYEQALTLALSLSAYDRVRLIEELASALKENIPVERSENPHSLYGILKGVSVSEEDIDEVRREMWKNFPREDI